MTCQPAISSHSLGRAWVHKLPPKLSEAARYGIRGIEIFHEDLEYVAQDLHGGCTPDNQLEAADLIRSWCQELSLTIICLQPFRLDEGLNNHSQRVARRVAFTQHMRLANALGTDLILVPSSILPPNQLDPDISLITSDLREVANLAAHHEPPIRIAFEALCFGSYIRTWEQAWEIVTRVNMPNLGICLDTFNIAGSIFADPASPTGKTPDADINFAASLQRLVTSVDVEKVFLVQVVDAERLVTPLVQGHEYHVASQPPRMSWSRNCRLFYGEEERGAYLPVREILGKVLGEMKYKGWISAELFHRSLGEAGSDVPGEHAKRAEVSWRKIVEDFGLDKEGRRDSGVDVLADESEEWAVLDKEGRRDSGVDILAGEWSSLTAE